MKAATLFYVLVADAGRARIYRSTVPFGSLQVIYTQTTFAGRKQPQVATLDPSGSEPGSGLQQGISSDDRGFFVSDVCRVLQSGLLTDGYDALVLIAPLALLDSVIGQLSRACRSTLVATFEKAPGPMSEEEVIRLLDGL